MRLITLFAAVVASSTSLAQPTSSSLALEELSACNATFFRALAARRSTLSDLSKLDGSATAAAFSVPERRHPTESRTMFKRPIQIESMKIVGFFDEILDIPDGMSSYSWGYLIEGAVPSTAAAAKKFIWDPSRLRSDGPVFVRSEVWSHSNPSLGWAKVQTEAGVPKQGTIERVFLIEPYDGEATFIRMGCALQGNITEPVLREIRPDLRP